ncbi:MarR family transcriptional regulator [Actinomadura sp. KC345]|uniref:MarR family winged helix-turn-helix transcriptional regulator n=1 Tax=Actinomadura sp. KC345 TaxID=2530371 RepID=UPI00104FD0B2|nr:MarR family transcriptional regulator [Actinomadura sp. KC345]TDC54967.1 MarR family transcriptional regulator [Actinomadura sp. KC345]
MSVTATASERELAERLNQRLRHVVLMLRQVSADQPITSQQLSVLGSLEHGPRRMTELAAEHGVRLPTMTAQINRLERDGLVTRGRDGADARVVTARLTEAGRHRLAAGRHRRIGILAERLANLTDEERAAVAAALPALDKLFGTP